MQYDILQAAYLRSWTLGCHVTLTFSNPSADGMWCGYRVRPSTNPVGAAGKTLSYIQEMRDSEVAPLNNSGSQTKVFKFYVPNARVLGVTASQYADRDYGETTAGTLPTESVFIEPYALSTSSTGLSDTIRYNVKLVYDTRFTNPVTQAQS